MDSLGIITTAAPRVFWLYMHTYLEEDLERYILSREREYNTLRYGTITLFQVQQEVYNISLPLYIDYNQTVARSISTGEKVNGL